MDSWVSFHIGRSSLPQNFENREWNFFFSSRNKALVDILLSIVSRKLLKAEPSPHYFHESKLIIKRTLTLECRESAIRISVWNKEPFTYHKTQKSTKLKQRKIYYVAASVKTFWLHKFPTDVRVLKWKWSSWQKTGKIKKKKNGRTLKIKSYLKREN